MLGQVHDHIVRELGESSRTDTIFVLTAIAFNLIVLAVNAGLATAGVEERAGAPRDVQLAAATYDMLLAVFIGMTALVNGVAVTALVMGRRNSQDASGRAGGHVPGQRGGQVLRSVPRLQLWRTLSAVRQRNRIACAHGHRSPSYHTPDRLSALLEEAAAHCNLCALTLPRSAPMMAPP